MSVIIKKTSKNLVNVNATTGLLLGYSDTNPDTNSGKWLTTEYIEVVGNDVTISVNNVEDNFVVRFNEYDSDKKCVAYHGNPVGVYGNASKTFTLKNDTKYVRLSFGFNDRNCTAESYIASGNTIQLEYGTDVTQYEPYSEYGYSSKNLLQNTAENQTINGGTFTVNEDGSVTVNGVFTADTAYTINAKLTGLVHGERYILNGSPKESANNVIYMYAVHKDANANSISSVKSYGGADVIGTIENNCVYLTVLIWVKKGLTVNNLVFKPMIRLASITDDTYEPYIEPKTLPTATSKVRVIKDGITTYLKTIKVISGGVEKVVWKAGASVTYAVDNGVTYVEEVDGGASVLSPKTFTPTKSGWTFVGWREDGTASAEVLTSKVMGSEAITLYAVFSQEITKTFISYNSTQYAKGTKYYNNGNTKNASLTVPEVPTVDEWDCRGWSDVNDTSADANVVLIGGSVISAGAGGTYYGLYQRTITISFNGNGATGGSVSQQTEMRYANGAGTLKNPYFTLPENGFSKTNYDFVNWAWDSPNGAQAAPGTVHTITENHTFYAVWEEAVIQLFPNGHLTAWEGDNPSDGIHVISDTCDDDLAEGSTMSYSTNAINVSGYSKIKLSYRFIAYLEYNSYVDAYIRLGSSPNTNNYADVKITAAHEDPSTKILEIDVSGISGNVYITFVLWAGCRSSGNYQQGTLYVDDLKLY